MSDEHYRRVVAALGGSVGQDEQMVELIELQQRQIKALGETIEAKDRTIAILRKALGE